mmetsp:Transcript_16859/g.41493  ORF Transcript_16859/g.41493 Transcript_16859/m.41493 type:complete len:418 (-) Transcript_16859:165-1418(-)
MRFPQPAPWRTALLVAPLSLVVLIYVVSRHWPVFFSSHSSPWTLSNGDDGRLAVPGSVCTDGNKSSAAWEVVLGYSTGRVGTTTMSKARTYTSGACSMDDVCFRFETVGRLWGSHLRKWYIHRKGSVEFQAKVVASKYIPLMRKDLALGDPDLSKRRKVWADLSHTSVFLLDGFLDVLRGPGPDLASLVRLKLIRIRRARLEATISWCDLRRGQRHCYDNNYKSEKERGMHLTGTYSLSPTLRYPVEVPLPLSSTWGQLTGLQRGMWYQDEVEARWQRAGKYACKGPVPGAGSGHLGRAEGTGGMVLCLEVTWTKMRPTPLGSGVATHPSGEYDLRCPVEVTGFDAALQSVANFVGVSPVESVLDLKKHSNLDPNVTAKERSIDRFARIAELHWDYLDKMQLNESMRSLLISQLACL